MRSVQYCISLDAFDCYDDRAVISGEDPNILPYFLLSATCRREN